MKKIIVLLTVVVSCVFGGVLPNELNYMYTHKLGCVKTTPNDRNFVLDLVNTGKIEDGIKISHSKREVNTMGIVNIFYVIDYYENIEENIMFFDNYEYCNSNYNQPKK